MNSVRLGRPPKPEISVALRQAAERVMLSSGFSKLTIDGLVTEIGTTRPAFYRRYRTLAHLVFDVIRNRFGTEDAVNTGSLASDLLQLQRNEVTMFADPLLRNNLPGLLESLRTDPELEALYLDRFIAPRRAHVASVIAAAAERGEIPKEASDLGFICDVLLGPILARAIVPVLGDLDDELARQTVVVAMRALTAAI